MEPLHGSQTKGIGPGQVCMVGFKHHLRYSARAYLGR